MVGACPGQPADLEVHVRDGHLLLGGDALQRATDHVALCRLRRELGRGAADDRLPVARDDDAVGEITHLVETVADEEDRHSLCLQPADDAHQVVDLVLRQRRRVLVEDEK